MSQELDIFVVGGVFASAMAIDALSVLFARRSAESKAIQTGIVSAALVVLGYITMYTAFQDWRYIIPEMAGAFAGAVGIIKFDSRNKIRP